VGANCGPSDGAACLGFVDLVLDGLVVLGHSKESLPASEIHGVGEGFRARNSFENHQKDEKHKKGSFQGIGARDSARPLFRARSGIRNDRGP
jgi:hypothetical protein